MGVGRLAARRVLPRSLRNWVRRPSATLRWAWADLLARAGVSRQIELRPGWCFRSHPGGYPFAYHAQVDDPEQVAELDQFIRLCRPGMVLLDIGAHFGLFSLATAHYGGPSGRAVAVDPSPVAERVMRRQVAVNRLDDRVRVIRAAGGSGAATQQMVDAGIGSAGYFVQPARDHTAGERVQVSCVSIDELAATGAAPTHVKVDVEGFELDVLHGGEQTFTRQAPPLLFLELHCELIRANGGDPQACLDLLARWGLELYDVTGIRTRPADLTARPLVRLLATKPGVIS